MQLITEENIQSESTFQSFRKGQDLFDQGAGTRIKVQDRIITAKVRGTRLYTTQVEFTDDTYRFSCSCPYDWGGLCKHCVALALAVIETPDIIEQITIDLKETKALENVEALIGQATDEQIKQFIKEVIESDSMLLDKFRTLVHGQENRESEDSIDLLRNRVKDTLESFDLSDYTRFYEYGEDLDGYREEYELLYYGAETELDALFNRFTKQIDHFMAADNVIEAAKHYLALYEGILVADLENVEDEAAIYDGDLLHVVFRRWETYTESFIPDFTAMKKEDAALRRIIDLTFERIRYYIDKKKEYNGFQYSLNSLKEFFFALMPDSESARHVERKLKPVDLDPEDTCSVRLEIADKTENHEAWIDIAENHYQDNPDIAEKLLIHYDASKKDLVRLARNVAFLWDGRFIPYFYEKLTREDAPELYKKILFEHAGKTERIAVYRKLKKEYGKKDSEEFIQFIEQEMGHSHFYIKLLEEEKAYPKILDIARSSPYEWNLATTITPILNVYPDACLDLVARRAEKELENQTGRDLYVKVAAWLKVLLAIKDKNVQKQVSAFIDQLLKKYSRRPALKDEFRKAGLVG